MNISRFQMSDILVFIAGICNDKFSSSQGNTKLQTEKAAPPWLSIETPGWVVLLNTIYIHKKDRLAYEHK